MTHRYPAATLMLLAMLVGWSCTVSAQDIITGPDGQVTSQPLSLPYAFYNESFGAALAYVYGVVGQPQPQSSLLATVMAGSKGSAMGFFIGRDLRLPWSERLFLDPVISVGYFKENDLYIDGNSEFEDEHAGTNDSDENNFVTGDGWDNFFRIKFKYLLPIGEGRDEIIGVHRIDRGLLVAEKQQPFALSPLKSGKTYLELRPFYRSQSVDTDDLDEEIRTNGVNAGIFWDNRDFYANPSRGFSLRSKVSRDFGWLNSSESWTNVDTEFDAYFPLASVEGFRQNVVAINFWTAYSPSWEQQPDGSIDNRPPAYTGSTLGGLWKLRGYPSQRFSDKAAVYYGLEWRLTPDWNPFVRWTWLQRHVGIQWLQVVPFCELGRVAPSWNLSELHQDMKWSLGVGIRAWAKGIVVRIDTAASEEGMKIQMMVGHPFQF